MKGYKVAVVGATGLAGQEFVNVLHQRSFPLDIIRLYATDHSTGRKLLVGKQKLPVAELDSDSFEDTDFAFFAAGNDVSRHFVPVAVRAGALAIDSSTVFRMAPGVPLVVPEINPEDIKGHKGTIATPDCSTTLMAVSLYPLHRINPIKRVVMATYQSVSGMGLPAIEELRTQARQVLDGKATVPHVFPHQIAFNVLPEIDVFLDNGYTKEEWKIAEEARKIMHASAMAVSATCVRVPVLIGHCQALHVEFSQTMSPDDAVRILSQAPGIKVLDDPAISLYPQPWPAAGTDEVFVGRIRRDMSHPNGLALWAVTDNVRKGASLNAVQIAEEIIRRGWLHQGG